MSEQVQTDVSEPIIEKGPVEEAATSPSEGAMEEEIMKETGYVTVMPEIAVCS